MYVIFNIFMTINKFILYILSGIKLSRRIVTCCWDTMMNVLAVPLQFDSSNDSKNTQVKKMLRNELNKDSIRQMSVQHGLDALQKAATLANILGIELKYLKL